MKQTRPVHAKKSYFFAAALVSAMMLAAFFPASCSGNPEPARPALIIRGDFDYPIQYLDWCMKETMARYGIPGAAVVVTSRDQVLFQQAYGVADTQTGKPVTTDTVFRAGSITKTMTALAVMKLAEEGKLDIDVPLERIVPGFSIRTHSVSENAITVRHLLSHYSGIQNDYLAGIMGRQRYSNAELIDDLSRTWTCFPPGEVYYYSNTAYSILQTVIQNASGKTFDAYMEETFLQPLGMEKSSFALSPAQEPFLASGHMKPSLGMLPGGQKSNIQVPFLEIRDRAAGGLLTSTSDFVPYIQYLLTDKDSSPVHIVGQKTFDEMTRRQFTSAGKRVLVTSDYGLGFMLNKLSFPDIPDIYAHSANVNGFYSFLIFSPSHDLGMVIFTNSNDGFFASYSIISRAFRRFLEARRGHELAFRLPQQKDVVLSQDQLGIYEGDYSLMGLTVNIKAGHGRLILSMKGLDQQVELVPAGENLFRPVGRFLLFDVELPGLLGLDQLFVHFKFSDNKSIQMDLPIQMDLQGIAGEGLVELSLLRTEVPADAGLLARFCGRYELYGSQAAGNERTREAMNLYIPVKEFRVFLSENRLYLGSDELVLKLGMLLIPVTDNQAMLAGTCETVLFSENTLSFSGITLTRKNE